MPHIDREISDLINGYLDPGLLSPMKDHLAGCRRCRMLLEKRLQDDEAWLGRMKTTLFSDEEWAQMMKTFQKRCG